MSKRPYILTLKSGVTHVGIPNVVRDEQVIVIELYEAESHDLIGLWPVVEVSGMVRS